MLCELLVCKVKKTISPIVDVLLKKSKKQKKCNEELKSILKDQLRCIFIHLCIIKSRRINKEYIVYVDFTYECLSF